MSTLVHLQLSNTTEFQVGSHYLESNYLTNPNSLIWRLKYPQFYSKLSTHFFQFCICLIPKPHLFVGLELGFQHLDSSCYSLHETPFRQRPPTSTRPTHSSGQHPAMFPSPRVIKHFIHFSCAFVTFDVELFEITILILINISNRESTQSNIEMYFKNTQRTISLSSHPVTHPFINQWFVSLGSLSGTFHYIQTYAHTCTLSSPSFTQIMVYYTQCSPLCIFYLYLPIQP